MYIYTHTYMQICIPRYADDALVVVSDRESLSPLSVANSPFSVANSPPFLANSPLFRANSPPERESLQLLLLGKKKNAFYECLLRSTPKKEEDCLYECALGTEIMLYMSS